MDRKEKENMQCVETRYTRRHVGYLGCQRKRTTAVSVSGAGVQVFPGAVAHAQCLRCSAGTIALKSCLGRQGR
jgi:hypothetical protein